MGREIRRVPPDWQHPKDAYGNYIPLYDQTWDTALSGWEAYAGMFEEWHGKRPNPDHYRPDFGDRATAVQMYETVTEGTPVGPVFATRAALAGWLVTQGHSRTAADKFVECGWAPSTIHGGQIAMGIDVHDLLAKKEGV